MLQSADKPIKFGILPIEDRLDMSGQEFFTGMLDGSIPHPPIAHVFGFYLVAATDGQIVFEGVAKPEFTNPMGSMHGGWYGTLLDSALACAVISKSQRGQQYTTLEYKVNMIRSFPIGDIASVTGTVIHFGRRTATSEAVMVDKSGQKYAFGTTTCMAV